MPQTMLLWYVTWKNFNPVGIHTGDSIVFAPTQTLSDIENQMLRDASLKIIRALKLRWL